MGLRTTINVDVTNCELLECFEAVIQPLEVVTEVDTVSHNMFGYRERENAGMAIQRVSVASDK